MSRGLTQIAAGGKSAWCGTTRMWRRGGEDRWTRLGMARQAAVTQSLSRDMRPCDDIMGLIGEAVLRKREADTHEYWRDLYTGSEHHWQQGKKKQNGDFYWTPCVLHRWECRQAEMVRCYECRIVEVPLREKDPLIGIRKGQSWCTSAPFDEKERRRYEVAREDPEVGGEALFELEKRCEERIEWFRVQDQLVKEHRYIWSKLGKDIKWMGSCNRGNPGWDLEYIRWRGAGYDFYDPYMWTESSSTHRMKREAVRLRQLRPAWDRWVRAAAR